MDQVVKSLKMISIVFFTIIVLFSAGCGDTQEQAEPEENIESEFQEDENVDNGHEETIEEKKEDESCSDSEIEEEELLQTIEFDELIVFEDHAEVMITDVNFAKKVEPTNPDMVYSYYEAKGDDEIFLVVKGTFKNLEADEVDMTWDNPLKIDVQYQDKYNYQGAFVIEEGDGSDFDVFGIVNPLSTVTFYYLVLVPTEVEHGGGSLTITLSHGTEKYIMNVR